MALQPAPTGSGGRAQALPTWPLPGSSACWSRLRPTDRLTTRLLLQGQCGLAMPPPGLLRRLGAGSCMQATGPPCLPAPRHPGQWPPQARPCLAPVSACLSVCAFVWPLLRQPWGGTMGTPDLQEWKYKPGFGECRVGKAGQGRRWGSPCLSPLSPLLPAGARGPEGLTWSHDRFQTRTCPTGAAFPSNLRLSQHCHLGKSPESLLCPPRACGVRGFGQLPWAWSDAAQAGVQCGRGAAPSARPPGAEPTV